MKKVRQLSTREIIAIKSKKQGKNWSPILPFERDVIKLLRNDSGNYEYFDKNMKKIYVGSSLIEKHRIESYDEIDDPKVHPTKVPLRSQIAFFRFRYLPIKEARIHEQRIKQPLKFNMDSHKHEKEKRSEL